MARQKLGQHFLGDLGWRKRIFSTLPATNEPWVEIGPGHGEMTELFVAAGRSVLAVEADHVLAENLARRAAAEWPRVQVISGDVLQTDIGAHAPEKFRVYGNLPYYITSPILHHLFQWKDRILSIHIVIQFEVAERICAAPGSRDYGYLSAACQFYTEPKIKLRIPPGAFHPPPKVHSALVEMILPGQRPSLAVTDESRFLKFVQHCFAHKRKTLRNNLRDIADEAAIRTVIESAAARPDARAEQLTLAQFATIFAALS